MTTRTLFPGAQAEVGALAKRPVGRSSRPLSQEIQRVAPSAIIEVYELHLSRRLHGTGAVYSFHAGVNMKAQAQSIYWGQREYTALPIEAEGFEYNGQGQLPRPKLRISNQFGLVSALLLVVNNPSTGTPGNDLIGAKLVRRRTLARYVDDRNFPDDWNPYGVPDPTAEFPSEVYYISRKTAETRDLVEFELAASFDLAGVRAPRRLCIANMCNWVYRSAECGYTGDAYFNDNDQPVSSAAQDVCSKRLAACEARFAPVVVTGTVTQGSATLASLSGNELNRIATGNPIFGHGVPAGTNVAVKGTSSLTMSQAAASSTTFTRTGTLVSPDGIQMTVASTAGLAPGMLVEGPNVPSGTRISSISGTTLNLSIAYNPFTRGSSETRAVKVRKIRSMNRVDMNQIVSERWETSNTSGIQTNDLAGNTAGITTDNPHGTGVYAGTKVSSILANTFIQISKISALADGANITAIFWQPVTFSSATYTFTASTSYTIRADNSLPFGGFPGVGGFLT